MTSKSKAAPRRDHHGRFVPDHANRKRAIGAVTIVGAVATAIGAALHLGWFDRLFPGDAAYDAPDLAAGAPDVGSARAPEAFRPDPTAPVPASEREALRPATMPVSRA